MNEQDKQLLLKDLSARLPYGVKLLYNSNSIAKIKDRIEILRGITIGYTIWFETNYTHYEYESTSGSYEHFKPYLRPLSSMTEDEKKEYKSFFRIGEYACDGEEYEYIEADSDDISQPTSLMDWLNAHYFDYRGLIEMGLALPAPEGMYNIKTK